MKHAVALVPGFLGFDHRGERTYFADRFVAALRVNIEARCGAPVPVVPVSTLPTGSLAARQRRLLQELEQLDRSLGRPHWHLVGHSTGGLDAMLLGRSQRLAFDEQSGSRFSDQPLRVDRLRSVTTVSAPLYGTTLACTAIAALAHGQVSLDAVRELGTALFDLTQRDELVSRIEFAFGSLGSSGSLSLLRMLLARDLQPAVAAVLTAADNARPGIRLFSFATVAPPPTPGEPDALFRDLWRWAAERGDTEPLPPPFPDLGRVTIVAHDRASVPATVDHGANDGVVNTDRQHAGALAAVVLADHADVLGRYRRSDALDGRIVDPGLLTSNAHFRDDEFFTLVALIAERIAGEVGTPRSAGRQVGPRPGTLQRNLPAPAAVPLESRR